MSAIERDTCGIKCLSNNSLYRAQIEQEYGERLLKLSQIQLLDSEDGNNTFGELLESVPTATEATARAHIDLAQQIHHLLEAPLAGFIKDQKAVRKSVSNDLSIEEYTWDLIF